jgi:hypothetical protein
VLVETEERHSRILLELAVSVFLVAFIAWPVQAQRALMPVDEAATRPDFFTFRTELQAALARHDQAAVLEVVHPEIKSSFGDDDGIESFKKHWRLNEPDSPFWGELAKVLALGGGFTETDSFTAPYIFARWPGELDAFENVAVIGSNVRVRTEPRADAPILTSVSYSILQLDNQSLQGAPAQNDWTAVTVNGRRGYIATRFIRSPIDYRAIFRYSGGRWWLNVFVAGD